VNANEGFRNCATVCALLIGVASHSTFAQQPAAVAQPRSEAGQNENEGERDFDFQIGRWTTHLRRLVRPLAGSTTWAEYTGTTIARKVWDGRANLVELDVTGPAGRIEGLSLRLYNPESRQFAWPAQLWSPIELRPFSATSSSAKRRVVAHRKAARRRISPCTHQSGPRKFAWSGSCERPECTSSVR